MPKTYICPSTPEGGVGASTTGNQGADYDYFTSAVDYTYSYEAYRSSPAMFRNCQSFQEVTDGLSSTLFVMESAGKNHKYWGNTQMSLLWEQNHSSSGPVYGFGYADVAWYSGTFGFILLKYTVLSVNPDGFPTVISNVGPIFNSTNGNAYSFHQGGVHALWGDGSVRFLSDSFSANTVADMITISGGEVVGEF